MDFFTMLMEFVVLPILVTIMLLGLFNRFLPIWFCKHMGWHLTPKEKEQHGCNVAGDCPRCGKRILQDSQGGWS